VTTVVESGPATQEAGGARDIGPRNETIRSRSTRFGLLKTRRRALTSHTVRSVSSFACLAGKPITPKERPRRDNIVDLMDALRKSARGAAGEAAKKPAGKKPRKTAAGQKEMLMPIEDQGQRSRETAGRKPASKQQRKSD
jgi:hypothetical protein